MLKEFVDRIFRPAREPQRRNPWISPTSRELYPIAHYWLTQHKVSQDSPLRTDREGFFQDFCHDIYQSEGILPHEVVFIYRLAEKYGFAWNTLETMVEELSNTPGSTIIGFEDCWNISQGNQTVVSRSAHSHIHHRISLIAESFIPYEVRYYLHRDEIEKAVHQQVGECMIIHAQDLEEERRTVELTVKRSLRMVIPKFDSHDEARLVLQHRKLKVFPYDTFSLDPVLLDASIGRSVHDRLTPYSFQEVWAPWMDNQRMLPSSANAEIYASILREMLTNNHALLYSMSLSDDLYLQLHPDA